MTDQKELASKLQDLMKDGMSLEDALVKLNVQPKTGGTRATVDRVQFMHELNEIGAVRKALKTAFAKRSKATKDSDAFNRYNKEIEAGQAKLNELLADVNSSPDPLKRAVELKELPSGVIQLVLDKWEKLVEAKMDKLPGPKLSSASWCS
jgi:predicted  nucleic acid-binding Zn-ribbon protein